jgi:transmembrane sensor
VGNSTLPRPLSELFATREPEARLNRVWSGIASRRRRRQLSPLVWALVGTLAGCLLTLAVLVLQNHPSLRIGKTPPDRLESVIEPRHAARVVDFGEGARVRVGAGGRLEVLEHSEQRVTLALRRGLSQFDIQPGGARRFRIECAGVAVEVVGTQFSVERSPRAVRVEVQRGRVLVRGAEVPSGVRALDAGGVLVVETASEAGKRLGEATELPTSPSLPPPGPPAAAPSVPSPATPTSSERDHGPAWRQAASEQDWNRAWASLGADGVARQSGQADSVADLFALADVARLSGHPEAAVAPLRKITQRHAEDPRAAVAAFTLGRVWLDALSKPALAASAFRDAIALRLPASLAEDAQARLVEALARGGDVEQARAAAALYRDRYPDGARGASVDRWSPAE